MLKQNLAIAYEVTNEEIPLLLENISNQKEIEVNQYLIFYKNISKENRQKIKSKVNCKFIKVNKLIKSKFEIFKYLKYFKTIILTPVSNLNTKEFIDKYSKQSFSAKSYNNAKFVEYNFKKMLSKFNMFAESLDTSILCINDTLSNYQKIYQWCIVNSLKYYLIMSNRVDATLDLMIQKFGIYVFPIINKNVEKKEQYKINVPKINKKISGDLVSIIMSIYDREKYYKEAINSILEQTYTNIELIIVLEYSTHQEKILKELKKITDERVVVIANKEKLGFANSLNLGIQASHGKYIARVDDDDLCLLDRIEKEVNYFKDNPKVGIVGSFMQFFGQSNLICKLPINYEDLKVTCLYKTPLFHPTVMFNMSIIKKKDLNYKSNIFAEDYDLWSRLIDKYQINNIPEVLYYYRLNGENNSISNEIEMNKSHHRIMEYQLKKFLDMELSFDELQLLSGRIDVLEFAKNREDVYNKKIKLWEEILRKNTINNFYSEKCIKEIIKNIKEIN